MTKRKTAKTYRTIAAFARALGWPYGVAWRRLSSPGWPLARVPPWTPADVEAAREWGDLAESADEQAGSSGSSSALERWRASRAAMAALELRERRGELVRTDALRELLDEWRSSLRLACDSLHRRCGREAHDILSEAVSEIDELTARWVQAHAAKGDP